MRRQENSNNIKMTQRIFIFICPKKLSSQKKSIYKIEVAKGGGVQNVLSRKLPFTELAFIFNDY